MKKVKELDSFIKAAFLKWENSSRKDDLDFLEQELAFYIGHWYLDTKEKMKDRGVHYLGSLTEEFKKEIWGLIYFTRKRGFTKEFKKEDLFDFFFNISLYLSQKSIVLYATEFIKNNPIINYETSNENKKRHS